MCLWLHLAFALSGLRRYNMYVLTSFGNAFLRGLSTIIERQVEILNLSVVYPRPYAYHDGALLS